MTTEERANANSTFAIGGVSSFEGSFVVTESSVLHINNCAEKSAHRKSAKHYGLLNQKQQQKYAQI